MEDDYKYHYIVKDALIGAGYASLAKKIKPITKEQAVEDYEKLRDANCKDINPKSHSGSRAMDYFFFALRLQTKGKGGVNFKEFYENKEYLKEGSAKRLYEYNLAHRKSHIVAAYDVFRLYKSSINAFKPIVAKELYCKYNPKTILDFSAGWGGRCLAAMSMDINYIGFDTNKGLKKAYDGMVKLYPTNSKVSMHFVDSSKVDFTKYTYDFVFTSPPYFQKTKPTEEYRDMPKYENRDEFNEKFFFPVVRNSFNGLSKGGHFCLNIPMDMYEDVKKVLGTADKKYPLYIQSRYSDRPPVYKEFIYVWNKTANLTGGAKDSLLEKLTPVQKIGSYYFKRDDLFEYAGMKGGKVRSALYLIKNGDTSNGITTAGNRNSPQINIVASIGKKLNIPVVAFTSTGELGDEVKKAQEKGATIKQVKYGYESVISKRARDFAEKNNYLFIPFGMDTADVHPIIANQVRNIPENVKRIVVPVGSASSLIGIIQGVEKYRPNVKVIGVSVGANPARKLKKYVPNWKQYAKIVKTKMPYHKPAETNVLEDIELDPYYEAKVIPYLQKGDLLWIVGVRETI